MPECRPTTYDTIPPILREKELFCLRRGKVPYSITGRRAQPNHPQQTFSPFDEVLETYRRESRRYDGLGVALSGNICGIDLDHVIDDNGVLSLLAEEVLSIFPSYAEKSPSGHGVHILFLAPGFKFDKGKFFTKRSELGLEVYGRWSPRYFTLTGDRLNSYDIADCGKQLAVLLESHMRRPEKPTNTAAAVPTELMTDDELAIEVAEVMARMRRSRKWPEIEELLQGIDLNGDTSAGDMALCNSLAFFSRRNAQVMDAIFRESGRYRAKWDELRGAQTYGELTILKAIEDCAEVWRPDYRVSAADSNGEKSALEFLKSVGAVNNQRYQAMDDIAGGYLLADYLKPWARPVPESKGWYVFDGKCWSLDPGAKAIAAAAKDVSRAIAVYAATLPDRDMKAWLGWAAKWAMNSRRKVFVDEASSVYATRRADFDRHPWLLNLENGTLDLQSMELREHCPDNLLTQLAPVKYAPAARCERWESFVQQVMQPGNVELSADTDGETIQTEKAAFLQKYLGYCLVGDTSAEAFLVLYGPTSRNGKSVTVETVQAILGTYSRSVNADTLMTTQGRNGSGPSEDIARLAGVRMASVGEIQQGAKLDSARIKLLTGGDTVNARYLGENSFDFKPEFKLLLHTNHLPQCNDLSVFDSGRALVLPFSRHFSESEQDRTLKQLFREPENQSGILNWLIDGLREYKKNGLRPPEAVRQATKEYRRDSDKIARFVDDALVAGPDKEVRTSYAYSAYRSWCKENGCYPESSNMFARKLSQYGITVLRKRPQGGGEKTTVLIGYGLAEEYLLDASCITA